MWLYLKDSDLFDGNVKRILYVAPRAVLFFALQRHPNIRCVTVDIADHHALLEADLTNLYFPDATFDVVLCSHVLEHIPDDRRALREIHRVLKPGGWALLLVPIWADKTVEDFSVTSPEARAHLYGQYDHVRICGPDYYDRYRDAGFSVQVIRLPEQTNKKTAVRYGLLSNEDLVRCTKRTSTSCAQ